MRVLVVEDDPKVRSVLERGLARHGFVVVPAATGADAMWQLTETAFDAVVLDVLLPDLSGFEVCERMRSRDVWAPVLMLTALDDVTDRVGGLDAGADDYLVKPFHIAEVAARLRALLRRGAPPRPAVLAVGDLVLDPASRAARRGGSPVTLTAREFALLECLMRRPAEVLSRAELVRQVWDDAFEGDLHVVNVYIAYLREKIDKPFGRRSLQTVRGAGFRISDDRAAARLD